MGSVPRPKWVLANFSKSKHFRPYVDQELLYKHAYAASFKPIFFFKADIRVITDQFETAFISHIQLICQEMM